MLQSVYKLSKDQVSDCKELFILFDKDENGVLTFVELGNAMRTFGQRLPGGSYKSCIVTITGYAAQKDGQNDVCSLLI